MAIVLGCAIIGACAVGVIFDLWCLFGTHDKD